MISQIDRAEFSRKFGKTGAGVMFATRRRRRQLIYHPHYAAVRDPVDLMYAWAEAAGRAGRLPSTDPHGMRLIVRADGIADKPFTFHVGLCVCGRQTPWFCVFAERFCGRGDVGGRTSSPWRTAPAAYRLASHCASHGLELYLNSDIGRAEEPVPWF